MFELLHSRLQTSWNYLTIVSLASGILLVLLATRSAPAQTLAVLYSFNGGSEPGLNGGLPRDGVIRDSAGNFYGTAVVGGAFDYGTVFKLTPTGSLTVLYTFTGGSDGAYPAGALIRDASGNLYGVTNSGGNLSCNAGAGCGTIFKVDSTGKETVLFSFTGGTAGQLPIGSLIRDGAGNLYGACQSGGSSNGGIAFKLDKHNNETVIYNFTGINGGPDGAIPNGSLVRDSAGNLYGTTGYGGAFKSFGTVFKIDAAGNESTLYSFTGGTDGAIPTAGVILDSAGNLYGTTQIYGTYSGGVAFKLDTTGTITVLHAFGAYGDGLSPDGGLVRDTAGNLYGPTERGGEYGWGTIFKIDSAGNETILYGFKGGADGVYPIGSLIRDSTGHLYGVTNQGGTYAWGNVFKLTP